MPLLRELLVVVPHAGLVIPAELEGRSLSERFRDLVRNLDWHTDSLYDFRDLLDNRHLAFPYASLVLEANRHPDRLDECAPLTDVHGESVYRPGMEPHDDLRRLLVQKYLVPFHKQIESSILSGAEFLLDGHSTVEARGVAANQIDLMNYQHTAADPEPRRFSPLAFVEAYAEELQARLPEVKVTVNQSEYHAVYGHVCAEHSVNAFERVGRRAPAIVQETCERLYREPGRSPDLVALDRLRRAFAESLRAAIHKVRGLRRAERMIDMHSARQAFDFDCGARALQTVMGYYGVDVRGDVLLAEVDADPERGVHPDRMVAAARRYGFDVEARQGWSVEDVKRYVREGHPVIVLLQAWTKTYMSLKDWKTNFDDGHYAIVMGYNRNVLFFEDPASFRRTWLRENEFLARWHDRDPRTGEKLLRFGMVLLGREPMGKTLEPMG
jgi:N-formylglutamate amidohydrolase